ncbi:NAD(P)H-dependent oxidoreductase [Pendulispora rubella]|uniref:NAD(P)H-dependent oxidoreductase n=1 Tax=Pendulispora rubella TaxID=2741070 RepID=A0ABZ2KZB7_9BACT
MTVIPLRIVVIIASTREGRFATVVANWLIEYVNARAGIEVDVIDLVDHPLPLGLSRNPEPAVAKALAELGDRLIRADGFIVLTPEYNHSFPAPLKNFIDWHYTQWRAKPVAFVSYGGLSGGLRAVEQLRLVFAELHAVTVRDTLSFHNSWKQFGIEQPLPAEVPAAAKVLLDQLHWWADALRTAREKSPYLA